MTAPSTPARAPVAAQDSLDVRAVQVSAAALCVFGTGVIVWSFYRSAALFPGATVLAVVLQLSLLVIGFWVVRLARPLRAPSRAWSAAAVIWGATAATGCALLANQGLTGLWAKGAGVTFASNWSAALTAPLNEELLKLAGVAMIALAAPRAIRGPLDGMIYGALTGLGFQAMENITYSLNNIPMFGATSPATAVTSSAIARGSLALGSHWALTAVAGAGIGYLTARGLRRGAPPAAACLAVAMAMHLLFDAPQPVIFLKVLINLVAVVAFYRRLRRAYLVRARAALTAQVASGVVPDIEAPALLTRRGRRRRQRQATPGPARDQVAARQDAALTKIEQEAADLPTGTAHSSAAPISGQWCDGAAG
jgi:RsiW-degrading membrane proteinase PrsW (M82 family)